MKKRLTTLAACLSAGLLASASASAADDWWFDIEVIIFDRNVSISELNEQFPDDGALEPAVAGLNLIEEYLRPDIHYIKQSLGTCGVPASPLWVEKPSLAQILSEHEAWKADQKQSPNLADNDGSDEANVVEAGYQDGDSEAEDEFRSERRFAYDDPDAQPSAVDDSAQSESNRFSDGLNDEYYREGRTSQTENYQPEPEFEPVTDTEIAAYWVAFSGINEATPLSVPAISFCEPAHEWLAYRNGKWQTWQPDNSLPAPAAVPEFLDGRDWDAAPSAHLLPYDSLKLTKLSRQIRQSRGINRILHVAWRQPVKFGENKADAMRIIAGKNYAEQFTLSGDAVEPETNVTLADVTDNAQSAQTLSQDVFFAELNARLESGKPISFNTLKTAAPADQSETVNQPTSLALVDQGENPAIWQLDGYLKVYLKYINRVPYLHIDSQMNFRQPVATEQQSHNSDSIAYELKSVPFHQVRRVISKQIHYFDHPMFGMVVEIRRHQRSGE